MNPFSIGNVTAEPGSVAKGKLGSLYLSDGTAVDIPIKVVNGAHEGPVLWISAAMHGQEISGMGVIWELVEKHLNPATLRGTVVTAPLLNPLSFNGGTYFTPQDGYNFNRGFPGDPKGLTTARMANLVLEEGIKKVDYLIDFHANPEPAMCFSIVKESRDRDVWERSREMARAFGVTTIEVVLKYEVHRTGTMTIVAGDLGKPSMVVELIPWRRISPQAVRVGVRGVLNVMRKLGMVDGEIEPQEEILVLGGRLTRTEVTATRGGLVREYKTAGDPVRKGEVIGHIVDAYGDPVEEVVSPVDGWLLAFPQMGNQAVGTGDLLAFFVFQKQEWIESKRERMSSGSTLSALVADILKLSKVHEGERVALVTTTAYDPETLDAYLVALEDLGVEALRVILPRRAAGRRLTTPMSPYAAEVFKAANMVIRPVTVEKPPVPDIHMYTEAFNEVLFSGTRWLDVVITEEAMRRLFPDQALVDRTMAGVEMMEKADRIRITSEAGTDLRLSKKGRKGHKQTGIVDEPGMWDNYGFGLVACAPLEDSAEGTLVMEAGDSAGQEGLGQRRGINPEPIRLTFKEGKIVQIEGGYTALSLRRWLSERESDGVYRIAHAGWGTHDRAVWGGTQFTHADWESYYGCTMIHFGVNIFNTPCRFAGLGGATRPPTIHWGGSLRNCSFYLDDEQIVDRGRIVHPRCR